MNAIPTIEETIPQESLDAIKNEIETEAVSLLEAQLLPIIRKATQYTGPVSVVAAAKLAFAEKDGEFTILNDVTVSLVFPSAFSYDAVEQVQRILFSEMFAQVVKKYL